ncbi:S8 family peptidase [Sandarakinorhabdus sp.]|uniref:S8 family peptidase n=1 Tax=Sandarakinorhabdus sp. TaxID=1916663 RepID=UPI003F7103F3
MVSSRFRFPIGQASVLALLLAGCSGGGGGGGAAVVIPPPPAVTPAPTPAPAPAPAPGPSNFDTAEYRRSTAAVGVQAIAAYDRGASGQGITVAVIDSGVNPALSEFAGRISPASRDVVSNRALADERGHGTSVTGVILAARDGSGIHGVAPQATLLALRADTPGSCNDQDCAYTSQAITAGLDAAVAGGARVINISLGGGATTQALRAAAARASNAGIVLVLSAGNESLASPEGFANQLTAVAPTTTLVVGAIEANGEIADFSNRAGTLVSNFLVTQGVSVRSFNQDGTAFLYSGTSISAPTATGSVALLAEAFPSLTGAQIVEILLRTADDLGAPGPDAIYGQGRLNLLRAFQPVGGLTSGGGTLVTLGGTLGGPLGDGGALRGALAAVPVRDGYARPFTADLAQGLQTAAPGRLAARLLGQPAVSAVTEAGGSVAAFRLNGDPRDLWAGDRATMAALAPGGAPQASPAGHVRLALAGGQVIAAGHGEAATSLLMLADSTAAAPDLLTSDLALPIGSRPLGAAALAQPLGDFMLAASVGQALLPMVRGEAVAQQSTALVRLSRRLAGLELASTLRFDDERGSLAGTRLSGGFGLAGASTVSLGLAARLALGPWALAGEWRHARSQLNLSPGLIAAAGALTGDAASIALSRAGPAGDRLSLAVTRPLALAGPVWLAGGADAVRLGPTQRETALEAAYARPLPGGGQVQFSLFHRDHPGHIAEAPADQGAAVRLFLGW